MKILWSYIPPSLPNWCKVHWTSRCKSGDFLAQDSLTDSCLWHRFHYDLWENGQTGPFGSISEKGIAHSLSCISKGKSENNPARIVRELLSTAWECIFVAPACMGFAVWASEKRWDDPHFRPALRLKTPRRANPKSGQQGGLELSPWESVFATKQGWFSAFSGGGTASQCATVQADSVLWPSIVCRVRYPCEQGLRDLFCFQFAAAAQPSGRIRRSSASFRRSCWIPRSNCSFLGWLDQYVNGWATSK